MINRINTVCALPFFFLGYVAHRFGSIIVGGFVEGWMTSQEELPFDEDCETL